METLVRLLLRLPALMDRDFASRKCVTPHILAQMAAVPMNRISGFQDLRFAQLHSKYV